MIKKEIIASLLKDIVEKLKDKKYKEVVLHNQEESLTPKDIEEAILSYPGKLTLPSMKEFLDFKEYWYDSTFTNHINKKEKRLGIIEFGLWFDNQVSDLTIITELSKVNDNLSLKIEDIKVL